MKKILLGPLLFFLALLWQPPGLSDAAHHTLAATLWMAAWWITEAVPLGITALLPLILYPLLGIDQGANRRAVLWRSHHLPLRWGLYASLGH